jgi:LPS-assembly lipoprotein
MALLLVLVVATSACGFKLRGQLQIPPGLNPLYIQADQGSALRRTIVDQLQGSKVRLAARPQDARVILRIQKVARSSRVIAVDRNGKALASELYYRVTFDAVTPDGKQLASRQTIDITRTYENPDVEVLGKQSEESLIYEEMIRDAADRILDRMRAALV